MTGKCKTVTIQYNRVILFVFANDLHVFDSILGMISVKVSAVAVISAQTEVISNVWFYKRATNWMFW